MSSSRRRLLVTLLLVRPRVAGGRPLASRGPRAIVLVRVDVDLRNLFLRGLTGLGRKFAHAAVFTLRGHDQTVGVPGQWLGPSATGTF